MIPNPGKLFGGTGVSMYGLLKLTNTCKNKHYRGTGCISSSYYSQQEVRYGSYGFGSDVKFLTMCKSILAINNTISMASNKGSMTLEPSN